MDDFEEMKGKSVSLVQMSEKINQTVNIQYKEKQTCEYWSRLSYNVYIIPCVDHNEKEEDKKMEIAIASFSRSTTMECS